MDFVDGFVAAVTTTERESYRAHCAVAAQVFKDLGALAVVDCWGEDVPEGKLTSFPMAVQCQAGETVVFGWISWPSRQVRDVGMKQAMQDPRLQNLKMPFDGKRMIFGGFSVLSNA